eukprot:444712-Hanusia_phi.AAC.1
MASATGVLQSCLQHGTGISPRRSQELDDRSVEGPAGHLLWHVEQEDVRGVLRLDLPGLPADADQLCGALVERQCRDDSSAQCQRIAFECSSPNGILLFREASSVLFSYGQRILNGVPPTYKDKYKGISICLTVLNRLLSGGYVNFGVFQLYGDSALNNALNIVLQLSLSIPMQDLMAYTKVFPPLLAPLFLPS